MGGVYYAVQPQAQSLFLLPIVTGYFWYQRMCHEYSFDENMSNTEIIALPSHIDITSKPFLSHILPTQHTIQKAKKYYNKSENKY